MRRLALIIGPVLSLVLIVAAAWYFWPAPQDEGPYAALKQRAKLSIGVRTGAEPFSYLDPTGQILGFEPELARELARELGLTVALVPVDASNAIGYLERGVIDLAILPLPGVAEDGPTVHLVEPGYYASGLTAVTRGGMDLSSWDDLAGLTACGITGDKGAAPVIEEFGARFIGFSDTVTALQALEAERCDALVEDETVVADTLADLGSNGFEQPLDTIDVMPWRISVAADEEELTTYLHETLSAWHRSGYLIDRAATWDLPESHYLTDTKAYLREMAIN